MADGSIIPAIITIHIATSNSRCARSHVSVIIHADGPIIEPYMSRAIGTIHAQQASVTSATTAMSALRSVRTGAAVLISGEGTSNIVAV